MEDSLKNNFDKRGGELLPRELMERAHAPCGDDEDPRRMVHGLSGGFIPPS